MKISFGLLFSLCIFLSLNLHSQNQDMEKVPAAKTILDNALVSAKNQNKKVLLMFHASWCGWCHKMDDALTDPSCKKYFDDEFVTIHVSVLESKGKEHLENAGGQEMMEKYNEKNQGLPNWVILDNNANVLADSRVKTKQPDGTYAMENIGCPATEKEVENFIEILKKTTALKAKELAVIAARFRKNEN